MATGTDYLLESLCRLAGVDITDAKNGILQMWHKFNEQDALLRQISADQATILHQQKLICQHLKIPMEEENGGRNEPVIRIAGI